MSTLGAILLIILALVIWAAISYVCGRVCAELIHKKDKDLNEIHWFWFGVIFWWLAILLTLVVKENNDKE